MPVFEHTAFSLKIHQFGVEDFGALRAHGVAEIHHTVAADIRLDTVPQTFHIPNSLTVGTYWDEAAQRLDFIQCMFEVINQLQSIFFGFLLISNVFRNYNGTVRKGSDGHRKVFVFVSKLGEPPAFTTDYCFHQLSIHILLMTRSIILVHDITDIRQTISRPQLGAV